MLHLQRVAWCAGTGFSRPQVSHEVVKAQQDPDMNDGPSPLPRVRVRAAGIWGGLLAAAGVHEASTAQQQTGG